MSEGQQRQSFEQAVAEAGNSLLRASVTAGVHPKDPMRPLFTSIDAVLQLLGRMPAELVKTQKRTQAAAINSLQSALQDELARLIAENGGDLAKAEGRRHGRNLLITALVALLAVGGGAYYVGNDAGFESGWARATMHDKNLIDAKAWSSTAEGLAAYRMSHSGTLQRLMTCGSPSWETETQKDGTVKCWAKPTKDGASYGWTLP